MGGGGADRLDAGRVVWDEVDHRNEGQAVQQRPECVGVLRPIVHLPQKEKKGTVSEQESPPFFDVLLPQIVHL